MTQVVVVLAAAVAVDVTNFITASYASKEAFKTATLLKTVELNSLIIGEIGVGKRSLAKYILSNAPIIDASKYDELLITLESTKEVIITNLHKSPNLNIVLESIKKYSNRVVATSNTTLESNDTIDDVFSLKFSIPPLKERPEDIEMLVKQFIAEAAVLFDGDEKLVLKNFEPDLTKNSHSLKRQVMINYLLRDVKDSELMQITESFLYEKLGSSSDYRNFLYLYEVPLIRAGLNKFHSQLQLADKLGLNRNTLRKKIEDNKKYL